MDKQRSIFDDELQKDLDLKKGLALKDEGMEAAAEAKESQLDEARRCAVRIAQEKGTVTADDVWRAGYELGAAAGSLFKGSRWVFTEKRVPSTKPGNHGRELKVWRLR